MAETPKHVGIEVHQVSSLDTSGDAEFELYEEGEPRDLGEAIGLAVGAASMTWPVIGGVFRDAKAKRISDALEMYVRDRIDRLEEQLRIERQVSAAIDSAWVTPTPSPVPPQLAEVLALVVEEYLKAKRKHGEMTMDGTMTGEPAKDDALRMAALVEEVGEVAHELTYDSQPAGVEGGQLARLIKELVQVANVAVTWASYLVPGPAVSGPQTDAEDGLVAQAPTAANVRLWGAEGAQ